MPGLTNWKGKVRPAPAAIAGMSRGRTLSSTPQLRGKPRNGSNCERASSRRPSLLGAVASISLSNPAFFSPDPQSTNRRPGRAVVPLLRSAAQRRTEEGLRCLLEGMGRGPSGGAPAGPGGAAGRDAMKERRRGHSHVVLLHDHEDCRRSEMPRPGSRFALISTRGAGQLSELPGYREGLGHFGQVSRRARRRDLPPGAGPLALAPEPAGQGERKGRSR